MRFSHSKLDVVRQCLRKYHFQYVLKMRIEGDTDPQDFGSLVHDIAENYKGGGKKELLKLYKVFKNKYKFDKKLYNPRLKLALKNIHSFWEKNLKNSNYQPEQEIPLELNKHISLIGKVDVIIFEDDGSVRIIDYKTSKSCKYGNYTNQLAMYMYLIHCTQGIPYEKMKCEIVYLSMLDEEKDGTKILNDGYEHIHRTYDVDESDVAVLIEEIEAIHNRILRSENKNKWKAKPSWFNCTFCPFIDLCDEKCDNTGYKT